MSLRIDDVEGMQYPRGVAASQKDYDFFNQQYATSTHQEDHDMYPSLIVQPKGDADVIRTVKWAKEKGVAVAVKSGGHQYSGASSTGGENIQLDLTHTYKDMMAYTGFAEATTQYVYIGVSNRMKDLNAYLTFNGLFVPHGQCAYVCVGGHAQTGGYGQLGRSFGLLGDHIRMIRMIDHEGAVQEFSQFDKPDLFWAILGGSPGNFGIITHYVIEVYKASEYMGAIKAQPGLKYKGPHGLKGLWVYTKETLTTLLKYLAQMSNDPEFPRNYDLCVNVLSVDFDIRSLFKELQETKIWEEIQEKIKKLLGGSQDGTGDNEFLDFLGGRTPALIVVYAQWCPVNKDDVYDQKVDGWFKQFRDLSGLFTHWALKINEWDKDMATMTGEWIFPKRREFDLPYVKRTYSTNQTNLSDKWIDTVVHRIDLIVNPKHFKEVNSAPGSKGDQHYERYINCKIAAQIQSFGGKYSRFATNKDNGTSYSWRDSTIVQTLDCFHNPDEASKSHAEGWVLKNDELMNGPNGVFSPVDRRLLWGSWGDWNLSDENVWKCYYEDEEKYKKIGEQRAKADPVGTFTPNPFAVKRVAA
ncbi:hypothetical protein TWF730_000355 [Orbilia blumenaviensis]|uniref:FAD-binding PCMH-type domain-containing protein n=1 Tax=Orbilia blumenaviensis TaxID=1796055 RepID=A0AAV9VNJ2_9PEZI